MNKINLDRLQQEARERHKYAVMRKPYVKKEKPPKEPFNPNWEKFNNYIKQNPIPDEIPTRLYYDPK